MVAKKKGRRIRQSTPEKPIGEVKRGPSFRPKPPEPEPKQELPEVTSATLDFADLEGGQASISDFLSNWDMADPGGDRTAITTVSGGQINTVINVQAADPGAEGMGRLIAAHIQEQRAALERAREERRARVPRIPASRNPEPSTSYQEADEQRTEWLRRRVNEWFQGYAGSVTEMSSSVSRDALDAPTVNMSFIMSGRHCNAAARAAVGLTLALLRHSPAIDRIVNRLIGWGIWQPEIECVILGFEVYYCFIAGLNTGRVVVAMFDGAGDFVRAVNLDESLRGDRRARSTRFVALRAVMEIQR